MTGTVFLEEVCRKVVAKYQEKFAAFVRIPEDFWSYVSNEVARYFEVNPPVVEIRIKKENIRKNKDRELGPVSGSSVSEDMGVHDIMVTRLNSFCSFRG